MYAFNGETALIALIAYVTAPLARSCPSLPLLLDAGRGKIVIIKVVKNIIY